MIRSGAKVIIIEIKGTVNVMHLNHPPNIPPPQFSRRELSSTKPILGAKRLETPALRGREAGRDLSPALGKFSGTRAESGQLTVEKRLENEGDPVGKSQESDGENPDT